ncbi:MAG: holin-associated N-acetylmuramidase [Maritimibacter sp.]
MKSVQQIADEIIDREGGYVFDPDDPGGPTKYGVTLGTMQHLGLDLDGDGAVTAEDVRQLSRDQAREIFVRDYYDMPKIGRLPKPLQPSVFDMYVNAGPQAVRILQWLLCQMHHGVTVDGIIGPKTIGASFSAYDDAPDHIVDAYGIARRNYYYRLAANRPKLRKFATTHDNSKGGWIKRAEEFISPKYHLSEAEHRERVASWR